MDLGSNRVILDLVALAFTSVNASRGIPEEYDVYHPDSPYQGID